MNCPVEILLGCNAEIERKNLQPFGQLVSCFDYTVTDKLSPRSFRGRVIGYTLTYGMYLVVLEHRVTKVVKEPTPVPEAIEEGSDSDMDNEPENDTPTKKPTPSNKPEAESTTIEQDITSTEEPEQTPADPRKHHMKMAEEFASLYGSRKSTRER
jgi:hypothetical protein